MEAHRFLVAEGSVRVTATNAFLGARVGEGRASSPVSRPWHLSASTHAKAGTMNTTPIIAYDPRHVEHRPRLDLQYGRPTPNPERPARVEAIRHAIRASRWEPYVAAPTRFPMALASRVHEPAYLEFLQARADESGVSGVDGEWFPYTWPRDRALDTGTPISATTPDDAWRAAECALTAASQVRDGAPWSLSVARPPGHHAGAGYHGGYCYLNHAAIVAGFLLTPTTRVAILDLDIHHGNGTQDIFYETDKVSYASIHGEPSWAYPPHSGYANETGTGAGDGHTYNQPLPKGTGWASYRDALDRAFAHLDTHAPDWLVVSQGFDTFAGDRWGGFELHAPDFASIAERLRAFGRPTVIILEGGYETRCLADGTMALLDGLAT